MKKEFIRKVLAERIVDTRNYRYVVREAYDGINRYKIFRLPVRDLDTTEALTGWVAVADIK